MFISTCHPAHWANSLNEEEGGPPVKGRKNVHQDPPARALHGLQYWPFRWMDLKQTHRYRLKGSQNSRHSASVSSPFSITPQAGGLIPKPQVRKPRSTAWYAQGVAGASASSPRLPIGMWPPPWMVTTRWVYPATWLPVIRVSGCLQFCNPWSECEVWLWEEPHSLWFVDEKGKFRCRAQSLGCKWVSVRTISGPEFEPWFHYLITGQPLTSYSACLGLHFLVCKWE